MRAIPIDSFFEDVDDRRSGNRAPAYDWPRIVAEGRAARSAADGGRWRIGGLALLVERRYASGALQRFAGEIGESHATVRRYRWVAKSYGAADRTRFAGQSFSHFQAVAGLPDKLIWLERAERGGWSVDRLVRESRALSPKSVPAEYRALDRLRDSIENVQRWMEPSALLDDVSIAEAGKEWLTEALAELAESLGRLQNRVHQAAQAARAPRSSKVARYKPEKQPSRPSRVASEATRSRTAAALKARAVGR